jgi:hypothetical protein
MSQFINRGNKKFAPKKEAAEKLSAKKESAGLIPELPMFDYSVERTDRVRFNESKKKFVDYLGTHHGDASHVVEHGEEMTFVAPVVPTAEEMAGPGSEFVKMRYVEDYRAHKRKTDAYDENKKKVHSILYGQCTTSMRNMLRTLDGFDEIHAIKDSLRLWKLIEKISMSGSSINEDSIKRIADANFRFSRVKQFKPESVGDFYERFMLEVDAFNASGARFIEISIPEGMPEEARNEFVDEVYLRQEKMLAQYFIQKLDRTRYGRMLDELQNSYDKGRNEYPDTVNAAYTMAANRRDDGCFADALIPVKMDQGAVFTTQGHVKKGKFGDSNSPKPGNNGGKGGDQAKIDKKDVICYFCKKAGHYRRQCPDLAKGKQALLTVCHDDSLVAPLDVFCLLVDLKCLEKTTFCSILNHLLIFLTTATYFPIFVMPLTSF